MYILKQIIKSLNLLTLNFVIFYINISIFILFLFFNEVTGVFVSLFSVIFIHDVYRIFNEVMNNFFQKYSSKFGYCLNKKSSLKKNELIFFCSYFGLFLGFSLKDILVGNSVKYLFISILKNLCIIGNFIIIIFYQQSFFFDCYYYISNLLLLFSFIELVFLVCFLYKLSYLDYKDILLFMKRKDLIYDFKQSEAISFFNSIFWYTFLYAYICLFFEVLLNIAIIVLVVSMQNIGL